MIHPDTIQPLIFLFFFFKNYNFFKIKFQTDFNEKFAILSIFKYLKSVFPGKVTLTNSFSREKLRTYDSSSSVIRDKS